MNHIATTTPKFGEPSKPAGGSVTGAATASSSWRYAADPDTRDLRIDFLRGLAIMFVVVDHIELNSAFYLLSHERIGVVSGAELFVLLSGIVLGVVHRRRAIVAGWSASANRMWGRARLLYLVSMVVVIVAYLVSALPFLNQDVLTTWTDDATGVQYSLYGSTPLLAEYPVPPPAVFDFLFLDVGPYQFNVMGLYVVLLLIAPFAVHAMLAGRWWAVLAMSAALYAGTLFTHSRIVPSAFANQFPLLSWQFLFVIGLVVGFYRTAIGCWFERRSGRMVVALAGLVFMVFLFFTWNNPAKVSDPWSLSLNSISPGAFWSIYNDWFRRDFLGVLRVVNVLVVLIVFYAALTRYWRSLYRMAGWLLVPLGGATLYVFILHIAFALAVASLPFVSDTSLLVGTLTHAAVLLLLWTMVQTRFLYRWIPR